MKAHVTFKVDYKKDAYNWWRTAHSKGWWGRSLKNAMPAEIKKKIWRKSWLQSRRFLYAHLKELYKKRGEQQTLSVKRVQELWNKIEQEFFKRLEKIMGKPVYTENFTAYLTTVSRCPYDEKDSSFMVVLSDSPEDICEVFAHEVMHFMFHHYFWDKCSKKIGDTKTNDLKEALTFLLNVEFNDLLQVPDEGYPTHQKLREQLALFWKEHRDFDKLVQYGIVLLKSRE